MEFSKRRKKTGGRKAGTPNEATERKSKAFRKGPESACILERQRSRGEAKGLGRPPLPPVAREAVIRTTALRYFWEPQSFRERATFGLLTMKTAGRENPNHWAKVSSNRAHGAADQNRSCSIKWAAKQEKVRPLQVCFFLTFLFIELTRAQGRFCL